MGLEALGCLYHSEGRPMELALCGGVMRKLVIDDVVAHGLRPCGAGAYVDG